MNGVVSGGWEFVLAAYALTALLLGGYAVSVVGRFFGEMRRKSNVQ